MNRTVERTKATIAQLMAFGCTQPVSPILVVVKDECERISSSTHIHHKPPARGTALGFASTHGTNNQSGGAITVDSTPGAGTTFTIWPPHAHEGQVTRPFDQR